MFYFRSLTEAFIDFGSMCPIAKIGKNRVNRQRWYSIIVQFSNKKRMVYTIKCFGKVSLESTKVITSVDSFFKFFNHNYKAMLSSYFFTIRSMCFCFIKDNLFIVWHLFCEKRNKIFPEGSIIRDSFILRLSKYDFLVFHNSFLHKSRWIS